MYIIKLQRIDSYFSFCKDCVCIDLVTRSQDSQHPIVLQQLTASC